MGGDVLKALGRGGDFLVYEQGEEQDHQSPLGHSYLISREDVHVELFPYLAANVVTSSGARGSLVSFVRKLFLWHHQGPSLSTLAHRSRQIVCIVQPSRSWGGGSCGWVGATPNHPAEQRERMVKDRILVTEYHVSGSQLRIQIAPDGSYGAFPVHSLHTLPRG